MNDYFKDDEYWKEHINKKLEEDLWIDEYKEYLMQLSYENRNMEILTDYESRKIVLLKDLVPNWWGDKRYNK